MRSYWIHWKWFSNEFFLRDWNLGDEKTKSERKKLEEKFREVSTKNCRCASVKKCMRTNLWGQILLQLICIYEWVWSREWSRGMVDLHRSSEIRRIGSHLVAMLSISVGMLIFEALNRFVTLKGFSCSFIILYFRSVLKLAALLDCSTLESSTIIVWTFQNYESESFTSPPSVKYHSLRDDSLRNKRILICYISANYSSAFISTVVESTMQRNKSRKY